MTIADSLSLAGAKPVAMISPSWSLRQLSFVAMTAPEESWSSRTGFANTPLRGNDGPIARTISFFGCVPVMINPPMSTSSPVSTRSRVEILPRTVGPAAGIAAARSYRSHRG